MAQPESIESSGFPLAFKLRPGERRSPLLAGRPGRDVFRAEARQLVGHQKECVVHEGATGSAWRMVSDEGPQLKGTDLAPFPLGYFNAGLNGDLANRILAGARAERIALAQLEIELHNRYAMTGSFFRGDGQGHAEPPLITVKVRSPAASERIVRLVRAAAKASPALASVRLPLSNTFALYVNGRRRPVATLAPSPAADAADPFVTYRSAPAPRAGADDLAAIIAKPGRKTEGTFALQPNETATRVQINVWGHTRLRDPNGITETYLRLGFPGTSHFVITSDERPAADQAPSGLAYVTAGIAFCYMTQLARYIEHMKFKIRGVRLVQFSPFALSGDAADGSWAGAAEPVDTHLFLSGDEREETYARLMAVAANTCYLHATLGARLEPELTIEHNEMALP